MEKVFIQGIGWVKMKKVTRRELCDYVYRNTFAADCKDPTGIVLPEYQWYHFN